MFFEGKSWSAYTQPALAPAIHLPMCCRNHEMEARIQAYFGSKVTAAHLKMADTPAGGCCLLMARSFSDRETASKLIRHAFLSEKGVAGHQLCLALSGTYSSTGMGASCCTCQASDLAGACCASMSCP